MAKAAFVLTAFVVSLVSHAFASTPPVVAVTFPANGATVHGPVYYAAAASSPDCPKGIASMRIYSAPYISAYTVNAAQFGTFISLVPGKYSTVVQAWDYCGGVGKTPITVTVSASGGVTVYTPTVNTAWTSPIHFVASASANSTCSKGIASIRIYSEAMLADFSGETLYMIDRWRPGTSDTSTAVGSFAIDPATGQLSILGTHYQTASHNEYASLAVAP